MKIKFSLGIRQNEPTFFFEGELKTFKDDMHGDNREDDAIHLLEHLTVKNNYFPIKIEIEK